MSRMVNEWPALALFNEVINSWVLIKMFVAGLAEIDDDVTEMMFGYSMWISVIMTSTGASPI